MDTVLKYSTEEDLTEGYLAIAEKLVEKVKEYNPTAKIVRDWDTENIEARIKLVKICHENYGDDFILNPFDYLEPRYFD